MKRRAFLAGLAALPASARAADVLSACGAINIAPGGLHNWTQNPNGVTCSNGTAVAPPVGHRYWRLNMTATAASPVAYSLAEVQFRTQAGVPLLFSGGVASASSTYPGYPAALAADNDPATFWNSAVGSPQWWQYDYGAGNAKNIVEITIQARNDPTFFNQAPSTFTPQWSDDGANWTSMAAINTTWTSAGQIQVFPVTSVVSTWSAADATATGSTLSNNNLTVRGTAWTTVRGTVSKSSGKWYVEFLVAAMPSANNFFFGFGNSGMTISTWLGQSTYSYGNFPSTGNNFSAGFTQLISGASPGAALNDVWAFAIDFDAGIIWLARNNTWLFGGNPATAASPMMSFVPATTGPLFPAVSTYTNTVTLQSTATFQTFAPPTGFLPWG